ncbi:DUF2993 domain-containing protein [Streptomyces sp. LP05-1]|uniref:DUF2993 domain-containing protein n=1 Tax=Streptomyces pyxinae TaxID=2970734 RepID=A0ABT2CMY0_9ACTN|nr:DUF2993 domain-containing protein [Streptomyces sp. LP05-1]MCS0638800.1 DUF2993 domain-containing protein [Streptomyces sp. LP05-1]
MRALRILLITAVILGGLFVAADRLALNYAEDEVAKKIRASQGLTATPDVSIKGFPFLTQVAGKELDQVDIGLDGVEATVGERKVRITEMNATLHQVRLENNFSSAKAANASGAARISYDDLRSVSEENVDLGYGGTGKIKVTGTVNVLGRTLTRSVLSGVTVTDNGSALRVRADEVPGEGIPGLEDLVRERTDFDRKISGLPAGLKLVSAEPRADGLWITVAGTGVDLAG